MPEMRIGEHKISVIIPCYNQDEQTLIHIDYCGKSTLLPHEIIIVNDGGEDSIRERLKEKKWNTKIIYAKIEQNIAWNVKGAYNLGIWISTGDYVAIEDNDHFPCEKLYERAISLLDKYISISPHRYFTNDLKKRIHPPVGVCITKRETLVKMKGVNEDLSGHYGCMASSMYYKFKMLGEIAHPKDVYYYLNRDGGTKMQRKYGKNISIYMENRNKLQTVSPILRFTYNIETI